jgi:hypothetical protein
MMYLCLDNNYPYEYTASYLLTLTSGGLTSIACDFGISIIVSQVVNLQWRLPTSQQL